jgi:hypothetical protein
MKVIIQNKETCLYFSARGLWAVRPDDAQDFMTLLPAYQFAQNNVSGRFQVVLFCADDRYQASIIEGNGVAVPVAAEDRAIRQPHVTIQMPELFYQDQNQLN